MSRLDWFTIAIVGICLAAIVFLLVRTTNLLSGEEPADELKTELQKDLEDMGVLEDEETIDSGNMSNNTDADAFIDDEDLNKREDLSGMDEGESTFDDEPDSGASTESDPKTTETFTGGGSGDYLVIAGSFSLMHNAENFVTELKKQGYPNAKVAKFNAGKYASVIVDQFPTSDEASALVKELKTKGTESYVQKKRAGQ